MSQPQVTLAFEDGVTRMITVEEDQTIIDAAYKARINIPFDCRDGACGTCKAFCETGEYEEGEFIDEAMTEDEADEGYILNCQTFPISDMLVQVPMTSAQAKTGATTFAGEITELERLSESTVKLGVKLENRENLSFLPGQYMNIAPPNSDFHRSYSFSSSNNDDHCTFLVKYTPGGKMTHYLTEEAKVGDKLNLTGPMGSFFLRDADKPILLLAGGTGLAPVLSILDKLAENGHSQPVRLIYGATFNHDIVETERIEALGEKLADFDWFTVVSSEDEEHERKGYVTDHMDPQEHLHEGDAEVYLCGPPPMVEAVRVYLNDLDNPPSNFYYEKFTPNANAESGAATGSGSGTDAAPKEEEVTVTHSSDEKSKSMSVSYGDRESGEIHLAKTESEVIFEALRALEIGVARLLINQLDDEDLDKLQQLAEKANKYIHNDEFADVTRFIDANNDFHEYLFDRSGNPSMQQAYAGLRNVEIMQEQLEDGFQVQPGLAQDHLDFVQALKGKDIEAVKEVVSRHSAKAVGTMNTAIEKKAQIH
ncbi:benzene 1,2-dioxygenase [Corynebacterium yudongzhengii]|uniref:FCD domain-containing protein n=1 Tax=Corynebacterium yudongzhengii TaxID=2080740 RepID=A0A2U1T8W9_9CORY|nr:benzoate 1,2-dioxygenase electron transfer component BenC [Corynebacterium yudongzhengii]AWB82501.1 benzene 1,2-dioxygenase [Corynebacterium yudongzhengii]PWC02443.1 FCD domain-containing protein [Corynebacterium yudongzhengii]